MASRMGFMIFALLAFVCGASDPGSCGNAACDGDDTILFQSSISNLPAAQKAALTEEAADVWSGSTSNGCQDGYCFNGDATCAHEIQEGWAGEERRECFDSGYGMTCAGHHQGNTHTRVGNDCKRCEGHWTEWSACGVGGVTCGTGHRTRTWAITGPVGSNNLQNDCKKVPSMQTEECHVAECPVHCVHNGYSAAEDVPACSKSCGGGKRYSCLDVVTHAQHGGTECPETLKEEDCNTQPCPVDCVVEWETDWSECSKTCGAGKQTLSRNIVTQVAHGGVACPADKEDDCNEHPCPVDCEGTWGGWGECSATCGGGTQIRKFSVTNPGSAGGRGCPASPQRQECAMNPCPPIKVDDEIVQVAQCPL